MYKTLVLAATPSGIPKGMIKLRLSNDADAVKEQRKENQTAKPECNLCGKALIALQLKCTSEGHRIKIEIKNANELKMSSKKNPCQTERKRDKGTTLKE